MNTLNPKQKSGLSYQDLLKVEDRPNWLAQVREESFQRFKLIGFPTKKHEAWKYINLDPILNLPIGEKSRVAIDEPILKPYFLSDRDHERAVFVDGDYTEGLSRISKSDAMLLEPIRKNFQNEKDLAITLKKSSDNEINPFALINGFRFQDGIFLLVRKNQQIKAPIHLLLTQSGKGAYPSDLRIIIALEEGASASVMFDHVGFSQNPYFENVVSQIHLGPRAQLRWLNLTRESKNGVFADVIALARVGDAIPHPSSTMSTTGRVRRFALSVILLFKRRCFRTAVSG